MLNYPYWNRWKMVTLKGVSWHFLYKSSFTDIRSLPLCRDSSVRVARITAVGCVSLAGVWLWGRKRGRVQPMPAQEVQGQLGSARLQVLPLLRTD